LGRGLRVKGKVGKGVEGKREGWVPAKSEIIHPTSEIKKEVALSDNLDFILRD
jgi:hypothetical protein